MFVIFLGVIYLKTFIRIYLYSCRFIFIRNSFIYLFNLFILFIYFIILFIYLFIYLFISIVHRKDQSKFRGKRGEKIGRVSTLELYENNYMKIHFASALPRQYFCRGQQDFILRASAFTSTTSEKTITGSKGCKVPPFITYFTKNKKYYVYSYLLYRYCCTNVVIWNAMCSFLTSNIVL